VILGSDEARVGNRLLGETFNSAFNHLRSSFTQSEADNITKAKENDDSQVPPVSLNWKQSTSSNPAAIRFKCHLLR